MTTSHSEVEPSVEVQPMKGLILVHPPHWSILEAQRVLQQALCDAGKTDAEHGKPGYAAASYEELLNRVRFNLEALTVEAVELLDHLPWKAWKSYDTVMSHAVDQGTLTEMQFELVDMLHFIMNIAIALGMKWEDVERIYYTKHLENLSRIDRGY